MKIKALALLLSLSLQQTASAEDVPEHFMSWYDGWGTHTVWGIGKMASGGFSNAFVVCGGAQIAVKAIRDTHETSGDPAETESAEYAKENNLALLQKFEASGKKCKFKLVE
jgi:hypothetical protein